MKGIPARLTRLFDKDTRRLHECMLRESGYVYVQEYDAWVLKDRNASVRCESLSPLS